MRMSRAYVLLAVGWCGAAAVNALPPVQARSDAAAGGNATCSGKLAAFNHDGRSPCEISDQLCKNGSNPSGCPCRCSTIAFNLASACALCHGDNATTWDAWVEQYSCPNTCVETRYSSKLLHLSSSIDIPSWAHIPLTSSRLFDFPEAINNAQNDNWSPTQIVTPVVVGVSVALLVAGFFFIWYRRRTSSLRVPTPFPSAPISFLSLTPSTLTPIRTSPGRWMPASFTITHFFKPRPQSATRDASWEIDLSEWPSHPSSGSSSKPPGFYTPSDLHLPNPHPYDPYLPNPHDTARQSGEYFPLPDVDRVQHGRERSDATVRSTAPLLVRALPRVSQPTFFERFMKYKGEFRKAPDYERGQVAQGPIPKRWRIDRSRDSTLETAPATGEGEVHSKGAAGEQGGVASGLRCTSPVPEVDPEMDEMSVLLISRTPGVDFELSDDGLSSVGHV